MLYLELSYINADYVIYITIFYLVIYIILPMYLCVCAVAPTPHPKFRENKKIICIWVYESYCKYKFVLSYLPEPQPKIKPPHHYAKLMGDLIVKPYFCKLIISKPLPPEKPGYTTDVIEILACQENTWKIM